MGQRYTQSGFTVVELLVALFLSALISVAAFKFYIAQHNNMLTQQNVSDMQQNLRISLDEITRQIRNAGANLPDGLTAIVSKNTNPDSVTINYARMGGSVEVGDHTQKSQASPIHIVKGTDLSQFNVGDQVYYWHKATNSGEWFMVSQVADNNGLGWVEIYHQGMDFASDPLPGDLVLSLQEVSFYVDASDSTHPCLMRELNGNGPQIFADNVDRLDFDYFLSTGDTVSTIAPGDTVFVVQIALAAKTQDVDYEAERLGSNGRRSRSITSEVVVRNQRF